MDEPSNEITVSVSETVADALKTSIEDLPPLSDSIDPDGLDAIVSSPAGTPPPGVTVTFEYAGLEVFVYSGDIGYAQPIICVSEGSVDRRDVAD